jgi:hypothetical protein
MSRVLGAFGLLDFTFYGPFSLGGSFETYEPFISLIFEFFSGRGNSRLLNQWMREQACMVRNILVVWGDKMITSEVQQLKLCC